ncbi:MAG: efflux RND transporter permease subunit [Gammaproteobacteria bacterium]|nr:efflux RND transporter permease subunit [Gammaproteobacteria bacterium]
MSWLTACLRNKLVVYMACIAVCAAGLLSLYKLPITPLPQISQNSIYLCLAYPGSNAQTVQKQITNEVVTRLGGLDNVEYISTYSSAGTANIFIMLYPVTPVQEIETELKIIQAINSAHLPSSVPQPYMIANSGQSSLVQYVVSSKELSVFDLDNFILSTLAPKFGSFSGVLTNSDYLNPVVKIKLNPAQLALYKLDPSDVANTINKDYQSAPLGAVYVDNTQYPINLSNNFNSLNKLRDMIIGYTKPQPTENLVETLQNQNTTTSIQLKDIAALSFEKRDNTDLAYVNFNGENAAQIKLYTTTSANPFLISKETSDYVDSLSNALPADMKITSVFDISKIMLSSLQEVVYTIGISTILVFFVVLIFLGRLRIAIIPAITVPISLLGTMIFLNLAGISINLLTLLAMVIAVGLVVDDAVVVMENITRLVESGHNKYDAVVKGTHSIAFTIIGITLTLLAVYLPVLFSTGQVSLLLKPFALTLASAVLISGILALSLTPIMTLALSGDEKRTRYQLKFDDALQKIIKHYQSLLSIVIHHAKFSIVIVTAFIILGLMNITHLPKMIFPPDPDGTIKIFSQGSASDTADSLAQKVNLFSKFYSNNPEVKYYLISTYKDEETGVPSIVTAIQYKDGYIKKIPETVDNINNYIKTNGIKNSYAMMGQFLTWNSDNSDISFYLYGNADQQTIDETTQNMTNLLEKSPVFSTVNNTINMPQKQLAFTIDEAKAEQAGITRDQIVQLLSTLYGGVQMNNYFSIAGLNVPILVQLNTENLNDPQSFQKVQIYSNSEQKYYTLADFLTVDLTTMPSAITTFNNQPADQILITLNKGYYLSDGISRINEVMKTQSPGIQYHYVNNAENYIESDNETTIITLLGIVSVYFLLVILFKSAIDPFIVMLTVPFSIIGGALSLLLIHGSLNIFSALGLITLVGLITKHGIMIVQFANTEMKNGLTAIHAILSATKHRFRPIIMTTLAMIFGAAPLMLSDKIMYVSRQNLAIVLIGGLVIGTFFTLFIIPLVYVLFKRENLLKK